MLYHSSSLRKHLRTCPPTLKPETEPERKPNLLFKSEPPGSPQGAYSQPYHCALSLDNTLEFLLPESPLEGLAQFESPLVSPHLTEEQLFKAARANFTPLSSHAGNRNKSMDSNLSYLTSGLGSSLQSDGAVSLVASPFHTLAGPFSPSLSDYSDLISEASYRHEAIGVSLPPLQRSRASSISSDTRDFQFTPSHVPELPKIATQRGVKERSDHSCRYMRDIMPSNNLQVASLDDHMHALVCENEIFGFSHNAGRLNGLKLD